MGQVPRTKPDRLGEKLRQIRAALGLSQNEMIVRLRVREELNRAQISAFERGTREPSLAVLLQYARLAGVWVDVLIDDELDLPSSLPCIPKNEGEPHKSSSKKTLKRS